MPPRVTLTAACADDGLPAGLLTNQWTLVDGPAPILFANPAALTNTVIFPQPGQYQLLLTVSDSALASASPITLDVIDPDSGNQPPVVNPGADQTATLGSTIQLEGDVSDDWLPAGILNAYWRLVRGPDMLADFYPQWLQTTATFNTPGVYVFRLHADDGALVNEADVTITVAQAANQPPWVDAGPPQVVLLPTNTVTLHGTVTDDALPAGGQLTYHWEVGSADGDVSFDDTNSLNPVVTFGECPHNQPFGYNFSFYLVASDSELVSSNEVRILSGNYRSIDVEAGPDQTITLPDSASLRGEVGFMSEGGSAWVQAGGPAPVAFDAPWQPHGTAHFSRPGVYRLRLQAFDWSANGADELTVTVLAPDNFAPVVDAGPAVTIPIAHPSVALQGVVSDDGKPATGTLTTAWSLVSGPSPVTFADASAPATTASFAAPGAYVLRLTADDSARSASNDVQIMVAAAAQANQPPGVNAGPELTVTLPQTATLSGSVSDDGLPGSAQNPAWVLTHVWAVDRGPLPVEIADPAAPQTSVRFSAPGDYRFSLSASDGLLSSLAWVTVHVLPAVNQSPRVALQAAGLAALGAPLELTGLATDDGLPSASLSCQWSLLSGPGTAVFTPMPASLPAVAARADFSAPGDYSVQLVVSDGQLTATGQVAISVFDLYHGNLAPVICAGPSADAMTLHPVSLPGSVTDDGRPAAGSLATLWTQSSGPLPVRFANASRTNTLVTFYQAGIYVLQLLASDGELTSAAPVTFTVHDPTNQPPFVLAGADTLVIYDYYNTQVSNGPRKFSLASGAVP